MKIVISSGHGLHVAGARDIIDEVTEARKVTDRVGEHLKQLGVEADVFHENTARNQRDNVNAIINYHNAQERDLDVSVHFNAVAGTRDAGIGVETCYRKNNQQTKDLASRVSKAISDASGLILRRGDGAMSRTDLGFLNRTTRPAILLEVCFVNSHTDVRLYRENFEAICRGIAETISGISSAATQPTPDSTEAESALEIFSVSEERLQAMVSLGVMNSPDYWRTVKNVRWLDQLLSNAARPRVLDARIDNGITNLDAAFKVLADAGIIGAPEYWEELIHGDNPVLHLDRLLINIANRSRDPIERLVQAESGGEGLLGQIKVANVVWNRHKSPRFPNGIFNVIFANGINSRGEHVHQFTPVANGAYDRAAPSDSVKMAVDQMLDGVDYSQGATFFHAISHITPNTWHEAAVREGNLVWLLDYRNHRFYGHSR